MPLEPIKSFEEVKLQQFAELGNRFKVIRTSDGARLQATLPNAIWLLGGLHSGDFLTQVADFKEAKWEVTQRFQFIVVDE